MNCKLGTLDQKISIYKGGGGGVGGPRGVGGGGGARGSPCLLLSSCL